MRIIFGFLVFATSICMNLIANAQGYEVLQAPICFQVANQDTQHVYGTIETAPLPDQFSGYRSNFSIGVGEFVEVCTTGPLFPGKRVKVQLKTIVPIFTCHTSITRPVIIQREKSRNGSDEYVKDARDQTKWITCY